ncbi:MAG: type II toxin-antitoxin system MqsR family toxin [Pseudomonadales bacterium]|nr:type II toxin-antitoxin system MqsR family toxin [Pseudomonadales bacterium]
MIKRTPHHRLSMVKTMVAAGKLKATASALAGAAALGLGYEAMGRAVLALTAADFFKSMTTHADHRIWQDVYRPATEVGRIYLKLTATDYVLIVSFKEL